MQARHQIAETVARRGPGAIYSDELSIVGQRRRHGFGIVPVPRGVEGIFERADRLFVGLRHDDSLPDG